MDTDLDTLATALYVTCDDLLVSRPEHAPYRPESGFEPAMTDAELITLAVMSALLGYTRSGAGCATRTRTCGRCSPPCPASPATTSDSANWPLPSRG